MPTILASAIVGKAKTLVQDPDGVRWTDPEWLGWVNDGTREIAIIKPTACTRVCNVQLAAGTRQSLPADGVCFIEYIRCMGAGGTTPGRPARKVTRHLMDAQSPDWHAAAPKLTPVHYVFDPIAPKTFYVYPPSNGAAQVELVYEFSPADLTALSQVIAVDDIYSNVLLDYLLFRAYTKDSEFIGNAERSVLHRKAFENSLGLKAQSDGAVSAVNEQRG